MPSGRQRFLRFVLLGTLVASAARSYDLTGGSWNNGDIVMHLQLGAPTAPLSDGAADWNSVAESALAEWNTHLQRCRLTVVRNSTAEVRNGNRGRSLGNEEFHLAAGVDDGSGRGLDRDHDAIGNGLGELLGH